MLEEVTNVFSSRGEQSEQKSGRQPGLAPVTKTFQRRSKAERGGPPTVDSLQQSSQGQASNIVERKQPQIDNACTAQSTGAAANLSQLDPQAPAASTTSSAGDPVADADTTCRWLQLGRTFRRSSLLPLTFDQGLSKLAAEAEGKQNARNKHKELRYLKDILREMADYFAEVDAEELVESSGADSPVLPKTKAKGSKAHRSIKLPKGTGALAKVMAAVASPAVEPPPPAVGADSTPTFIPASVVVTDDAQEVSAAEGNAGQDQVPGSSPPPQSPAPTPVSIESTTPACPSTSSPSPPDDEGSVLESASPAESLTLSALSSEPRSVSGAGSHPAVGSGSSGGSDVSDANTNTSSLASSVASVSAYRASLAGLAPARRGSSAAVVAGAGRRSSVLVPAAMVPPPALAAGHTLVQHEAEQVQDIRTSSTEGPGVRNSQRRSTFAAPAATRTSMAEAGLPGRRNRSMAGVGVVAHISDTAAVPSSSSDQAPPGVLESTNGMGHGQRLSASRASLPAGTEKPASLTDNVSGNGAAVPQLQGQVRSSLPRLPVAAAPVLPPLTEQEEECLQADERAESEVPLTASGRASTGRRSSTRTSAAAPVQAGRRSTAVHRRGTESLAPLVEADDEPAAGVHNLKAEESNPVDSYDREAQDSTPAAAKITSTVYVPDVAAGDAQGECGSMLASGKQSLASAGACGGKDVSLPPLDCVSLDEQQSRHASTGLGGTASHSASADIDDSEPQRDQDRRRTRGMSAGGSAKGSALHEGLASQTAGVSVASAAAGASHNTSEAVSEQVESIQSQQASQGTEVQQVEQHEELTPLQQLLAVCGQSVDPADIPTMDDFVRQHADLRKISKIGEGTYGEAFKYGKLVFKVVPVEGSELVNGAAQKRAGEMAAEALIALTLSRLREATRADGTASPNVTAGFVDTYKVGVCSGPYSPALVKAWHKWDKSHTSENDPVDLLPPSQLYLILAMADCGKDLERASVPGYDQARSLLAQVVFTLAVAEEAVEFEHRDLHWGNVMVRPAESRTVAFRLRGVDIEVQTHGLTISLIDFTASRLRTLSGALAYCDLSQDPELFEGPKGQVQFDTYRWMKRLVDASCSGDWQASCLATNSLWIAYLAEILLSSKGLTLDTKQKKAFREFRKRATQAGSCSELVFDTLFTGLWLSSAPGDQ